MTRVAWLTDIHLNFLEDAAIETFLAQVRHARPDAVLLGGDIGEARNVAQYLIRLHDALDVPLYFVLGNHDFYGGSIAEVRRQAAELSQARPELVYLSASEPITLSPDVALVGHDGWADGRVGDYERSLVMMSDYKLIAELACFSKQQRWDELKALGDQAAAHIRRVLPLALERHGRCILLTHVPPLREACWYEGQISDDQWAPHFVCLAMGEAILEVMRARPEKQLTVLCGHTHSPGEARPLPNVQILTGGTEYGFPGVQRVLEL
ncbi:MAG: metallophosphoesterase [Pirellulales bacterium]